MLSVNILRLVLSVIRPQCAGKKLFVFLDGAPNAIKIGVCCVSTILRVHSKWSKHNFALDMSKYNKTIFIFNSG